MGKFIFRSILLLGLLGVAGWGYLSLSRPDMASNPVVANGDATVVMNFSDLQSTENLPAGWWHRKFWFKPAMELSLVEHQGVKALRCETNGGGSIFARNTDIGLAELPILTWDWFIQDPIVSDIDEATPEGDDHPARLFLRFEDSELNSHFTEIIWSNQKYSPGDYKIIGDFPHYVANGLDENTGAWHKQNVDLEKVYSDISKSNGAARLKMIAVFCDSDNTGTHSVAYFSDVFVNVR